MPQANDLLNHIDTAHLVKMDEVLDQLDTLGFAHIKPDFYYSTDDSESFSNIETLQDTYSSLSRDSDPGNRHRAYASFQWSPLNNELIKKDSTDYFQAKEYNYIDGGKIRTFDPICPRYLKNSLLKSVVEKDIDLAKETGIIDFSSSVEIGLHQIRYVANGTEPAFSSPLWLHRDDEPLVFVHLFSLSENAIGGDNLIAKDVKTITHLIRLQKPLETLVLTKKPYHAVTPLGSSHGAAFRDILLVTFMNKKSSL
ncbi:unnamed protein product, partial [Mesorhabditis belari]|uniref:Uncharacterized protein n=1 Tax=Mesorhabditis belari TaxID=2138241 RepID=A0AAF3J4J9_9BILA